MTLLLLTACSDPEVPNKRQDQSFADALTVANQLIYENHIDQALRQLEILDKKYPNNAAVIEALAFAYARKPDPAMAAFYFDALLRLDPERTDMLLYSARAHTDSQDWASASNAYQQYLKESPNDVAAWKALGNTYLQQNQLQAAAESLTKVIELQRTKAKPEDTLKIAHIYHNINQPDTAQVWYQETIALSPNQAQLYAQAHLGLLEIALANKQWSQAEVYIEQIDQSAPAVLNNSPLASTRIELRKWRSAQQALQHEQRLAQQQADATRIETERLATEQLTALNTTTEAPNPEQAASTEIIAVLIPQTSNTEQATSVDTVAVLIPQARNTEPQAELATLTSIPSEPLSVIETPPTATLPLTPSPSFAILGERAYTQGEYPDAIRYYHQELNESAESPELYYKLSKSYYKNKQWPEAELFAAEAKRLDPNELRYSIQYLATIQRSQPRAKLLDQLLKAKTQFPESADITLALAKGYEHIDNNRRNAYFLYQEFLEIAPNHPQAYKVRSHISNW